MAGAVRTRTIRDHILEERRVASRVRGARAAYRDGGMLAAGGLCCVARRESDALVVGVDRISAFSFRVATEHATAAAGVSAHSFHHHLPG